MGFIFTSEGDEALVTINDVLDREALQAMDRVTYQCRRSERGKRAFNVQKINLPVHTTYYPLGY